MQRVKRADSRAEFGKAMEFRRLPKLGARIGSLHSLHPWALLYWQG